MSAEDRRQQLLDATRDLVLAHGFHDLSVNAVAERAGVTRAVIYQHFDDLDDLLGALIERSVGRAEEAAASAESLTVLEGDPHELMLESVRNFVATVVENPAAWRLVLSQPDGAPEALRERLAAARADLLRRMTGAVRPLFSESEDPQLTASVLSAIANHYAHLALSDPVEYSQERIAANADWMIRGFLARSR